MTEFRIYVQTEWSGLDQCSDRPLLENQVMQYRERSLIFM